MTDLEKQVEELAEHYLTTFKCPAELREMVKEHFIAGFMSGFMHLKFKAEIQEALDKDLYQPSNGDEAIF